MKIKISESIWFIVGTEEYDGTACFLNKNGTYSRVHYNQAEDMSKEEAKNSLNLLNKRLSRPARIAEYII